MTDNFLLKKAPKFAAIIDPKLPYIEMAVLLIIVIAGLTKGSNKELSEILILISISSLSVLYFFNAYRIDEGNQDAYKSFLAKLSGWANSVSLLGILFSINHYAGSGQMMTVGILTQLLILAFTFGRKYLKKTDTLRRVDIVRSIALLLLLGTVYFTQGY